MGALPLLLLFHPSLNTGERAEDNKEARDQKFLELGTHESCIIAPHISDVFLQWHWPLTYATICILEPSFQLNWHNV